jgi:hypothetical protein
MDNRGQQDGYENPSWPWIARRGGNEAAMKPSSAMAKILLALIAVYVFAWGFVSRFV